jgi:3',5'-cyclic-AMP phosphodiesterase
LCPGLSYTDLALWLRYLLGAFEAMTLNRRNLFAATPIATAGLAFGIHSAPKRTRALLLTDIHLPATGQNERVERCLERALKEKPDLILLGGDQVMDVDRGSEYPEADANAQFANFRRVVMERLKGREVAPVLGNHDLFHNSKAKAIAAYEMPHRYYRKDVGDWRFLMLDTFHEDRTCRVDDEQMAWLKAEIEGTKKPVLVLSHAPILTVTSFIENSAPTKKGGFDIPERWQTANLQPLRDLFFDHPNVRVAVSGHMHQIDDCRFDNVAYVCGGAVSGNWWNGAYYKFPPAYIVFDLEPNGNFTHRVVYWEK